MTMEVEEVQVKLEDGAKASGDTSEKVLVDEELLKVLFSILAKSSDAERYKHFYKVNENKEVECFDPNYTENGWDYTTWRPLKDKYYFGYARTNGFLCPELSNLSFEEIKKLGETSAPGVYFKGKKVWDL